MKKLLAMVLALVMTLSLAVSANAAFKDAKDVDETFAEAVDVLNGLGVFKGYEDGSFNPKGDITRAEVAAIVYRIYTSDVKDTYVKNYETYNKFSDMAGAGWAKGYIGYCANAALVKGYPNGTFVPSGKVTGYEVLAMILRAVGYDQNNEFTGADWSIHVAQIAEQNKILKNVKGIDLNKAATRELVAELLFQAIQVPMVTYTAAFGYQNVSLDDKAANNLFSKNETLGRKSFELDSYEGYVTYSSKKDAMILTGKDADKKDVEVKVADQDIFDAGRYGHVWTSDKTAISSVFYDDTLLATKYESWDTNWTTKGKTDFIAKEGDMNYFLNGKAVEAREFNAAAAIKGSEKAIYDIDGDGDIDTVVIVNPTVDVMTADYLAKNDKVKIQGKTFDKDEVSGYENLAKDDVFTYVDMADGVRYFEELEAIAGQKSAYTEPKKGDNYITFDGKDYEQSGLKGKSDNAELFSKIKKTFDKDGYVYLDRGGFVVYTSWTKGATALYGMIIDAYSVLNDKHTGVEYYANILTTEGEETGYVEVDMDDYKGDIEFTNVLEVGKKTTTPEVTADYENLGILVKYTVKDGVYTLTDATDTDGSYLAADYKQGAATLKVDNEKLAVVDNSVVFFYWYEETGANKYVAHYGVNVGKYVKDTNDSGIPSYAVDTEVKYLERDGEALEAAVFNGMTQAEYDDYAYIYDYSKTTTTGSKLDVYTYYGVNSDGKVVEFSAYKDIMNGFDGNKVVGNVVWYLERQDGMAEFGMADATLYSLAKLSNSSNTVKAREEGANSDWDTFMNASVVYDVIDTDDLKVDDTVGAYDFYWDKTVQALVVYDYDSDTNELVVKCAFVIDDTVKYGEFEVNGVDYWYPVEDEDGDAIKYALEDLSDTYTTGKYHVTDTKASKTELIAQDAKYAFAAGGVYTTVKHADAVVGTITAATGTLSADGKTLTVPYGTQISTALIIAPGAAISLSNGKIVLTYESTSCDCTTVVEINVVVTAAAYSVTLSEDNNVLTATLSADAQMDAATIKFVRLNNGVENTVGTTTEVGAATTITIEQAGSYKVCVYNAANQLICESDYLDVQNDG